jgi:hypothetical protein
MNFEELNLEIPCLEMAYDSGLTDLDVPQAAHFRAFKTHAWHRDCPKGGRYIYLLRNPLDAGPSFYHFMAGWFFPPGDIELNEFLEEFFLARGQPATPMSNASHWHNLASWYPHRADDNVLWLHYEDLIDNLPAAVALIAEFIGVGQNDADLQALACRQASLQHMQAHPTKYDEHHLKLARNEACGLERTAGLGEGGTAKVRAGGKSADRQRLSEETVAGMGRKWKEVAEPVTGYGSYEEMRRGVNAELGRPFR